MERIPRKGGNPELREFWRAVGADVIKAICEEAGVSYEHFKHVAARRRRFSYEVAKVFHRYGRRRGLTMTALMMGPL